MTIGYLNDVYVKPWCRIAPYAIGLSIGYILYQIYKHSDTVSWDSPILRTTIHSRYYYLRRIVVWILALTILSLCIFGTYGDYSGHPLTRHNRIAFLTLSRLGWSIGVIMVIGACFAGHGGWSKIFSFRGICFVFSILIGLANRLLSHSCFSKLSKLTYGAYLWHSLVIFVNYLSQEQPTHYTITNIVCRCFLILT